MGNHSRRVPTLAHRLTAVALCAAIAGPSPLLAAEVAAILPPVAAKPVAGGGVLGPARADAFRVLAAMLAQKPLPQAGVLRAQAAAVRAVDGRPGVALWLKTRIEDPLAGVPDASVPRADQLAGAAAGLDELKSLLAVAPAPQRNKTEGRTLADARAIARGLSAGPSVPEPVPAGAASRAPGAAAAAPVLAPPPDDAKLGQRTELASPRTGGDELDALDKLQQRYQDLLGGPGSTAPGVTQKNELEAANLDALKRLFDQVQEPSPSLPGAGHPLAGTPKEQEIADEVAKVETLKTQVQSQLAARDALAAMLAVADRARDGALQQRRNGQDMLEFRKNFSRLAMVMDLSYSMNLLNSAEAALNGMQQMLDQKISKIYAQKKANEAAGAAAAANKGKKDQWNKDAQASVDDDKKNQKTFATLSDQAAQGVRRITEFKTDVAGLIASINGRDRGRSADAMSEYRRRVALLPQMQQNLIHGTSGGGSDVSSLSLDYLKSKSAEVQSDVSLMDGADAKIDATPLEFAAVLIAFVPGIPAVTVTSPNQSQMLQILADRKTYWQNYLGDQQKILDSINRSLDAGNSKRVLNDFGDSIPESLVVYKNEEDALASKLAQSSDGLAAQADALASDVEAGTGASLPRLAGKSADQLRTLLPNYVDQLEGLTYPDTDAGFKAKMSKIGIAKLITFMGDLTLRRLEAAATSKALDKPINEILPKAKTRFAELVASLHAVLDDVALDQAYISGGGSGGQAIINRKRALIDVTLRPTLQHVQELLDGVLIPYQQERITLADPNAAGDSLAELYRQKQNLFTQISDGLHKTFPWGLASGGAKSGDVGGAKANIDAERKQFGDYRKLVTDLQDQIRRRKDPNGTETEDVYGEPAPYSLVRRAQVYQQEKVTRAAQINSRDAEINAIMAKMDALFPGKYNLVAKYKLPTDVSATAADSVTRLKAMADGKVLQNMAGDIKSIAEAASAAAGSTELAIGGGGGSIPTGNQPPLTLANLQQLALYGLDVVKRLVPTTAAAGGDSVAECLARFLFADALIVSANMNLTRRIPIFEAFLNKGSLALDQVFADLDADAAYVASDLSGGDGVLERKLTVYTKIRDTAKEGADLFGQKVSWDTESFQTVTDVTGYYDSLGQVYSSGDQALDADRAAAQKFKDTLTKAQQQIAKQKAEVSGWLKQLNDPHESALRRVTENLSAIQDKTRAVLETNIEHHKLTDQYDGAKKALEQALNELNAEQAILSKKLEVVGDLRQLSPDLARRIQAASGQGSSWLATGPGGPQTIVIPKSQFSSFLSQLFGAISADSTARDIVGMREEILKNPMSLAQLLPNTKMVEVGQGSDGFYLVYQTEFSTPGGLETSNQLTMGNVLNLFGNNVSVIGHRFASPPSDGNAPFGDQGITVQVESLQGKNFVNYLDVTFHKFIQDIPPDLTVGGQVQEARMMVFDDFAIMLANGKLYFGAAGFADFAAQDAANKPYYYGGNVKASVKFTEIMSLNAEESALFAKDPRKFLQTVNLDFTNYDPDLDKNFVIGAQGENKFFRRDKVGVGFDLQKALETKDSFKVDFYLSRVTGTDDIQQNAIGTTILKGFAFDLDGTPVKTTLSGTGELGEKYNTFQGKVSFELPKQGLTLSAQGEILGDADTYFVELKKKLGTNTEAFVSYGSRYVGLNNRLTIGTQTTFTLGELWRLVSGAAAEDLQGGQTLKKFNEDLDAFFKRQDADNRLVAELKRVFDADIGKKLLSLQIGEMTRQLQELEKAGAILDNVKMHGMIGFVSNPVGTGTAERATGGGFQVGTLTEMTMTKSQKALVHNEILGIFQQGLALQTRLLDLTKSWQAALVALVESRWDMSLAAWMYANADDPVIRAEAQTRALEAADRHRQALLKYNSLTGRGPDDTAILDELTPGDLDGFSDILQKAMGRPDRIAQLLGGLRQRMDVPKEGFNLMDWIPLFEKITFSLGVQLQDVLANQVIGVGVSLRLPIYDPTSKYADKALRLEDRAIIAEMAAALKDFSLKARQERQAAEAWDAQFWQLQKQSPEIRQSLADGIRQWRNGMIGQGELWGRFRRWYWATSSQLQARAEAALKDAWSILDAGSVDVSANPGAITAPPASLKQGFDAALQNSPSWEALAERSQAAQELMQAASSRFQKVSVDLNIGTNLTATGIALLPAFGITGLGIFPIFNIGLQPGELKELSMERRGGEAQMYSRLHDKVGGDLALQLFQSYGAYQAARDSLDIYNGQLIPELEKAQDGGAQKQLELDQARAQQKQLEAELRQARSQLNYLLGRPLDADVGLKEDMDTALAELQERLSKADPLAASRDVLASRVKVAQSVETIVDKNLKLQDIRIEPISLIGRSLGRLISALSGEGLASPELVAAAREQTLTAQRDLRSFDAQLPVLRARWGFELSAAERELKALQGKTDGPSRLKAVQLQSLIYGLKAMMLAYGGQAPAAAAQGDLPSTYAQLQDGLRKAFVDEAPSPEVGGVVSAGIPQETPFETHGYLRYYDLKQSLAGDPIGKQFVEGWIEVRLRSAATPPEALIALAKLQQEKADQLYRTELSQARTKADVLLARVRLEAMLAKQPGGVSGDAQKALERDFAEVAAHLRWPASATLSQFVKLLPADLGSLDAAVDEYLREAQGADLELLKRQLFQEGLPEEIAAARDPLSQMQANVIAQRMSYKGFTPVAAFGMFQGRWVGGVFLEAPDPTKIQKTLEGILNDALRRELESQDRLKTLALMLHSLMASVADKVKLIEAERSRLEIARRNLLGAVERARAGFAPASDVAAAEGEAAAAQEQFIETVYALRLDFIRLVTELEALGYTGQATLGGGMTSLGGPQAGTSEKTARQELTGYWAQRLLDQDFEKSQDALLSGLSPALREQLRKNLAEYRLSRDNSDAVLGKDYSAAEKLSLLTKVDVDGRRRKVEMTLELILREIEAQGPQGAASWTALMGFLRVDVESRQATAEGEVRRQEAALGALRESFWRAVPAPPAVEAAYERLSRLKDSVYEARQDALHHYLQQKLKPEDYVLKDKALEAYVKALIAYDNEVLKTFAMPDVARDPCWSSALNALFGLGASIERRRDLLKYGRGIVTVDAAMALGQARLDALRASPEARDEITPASEAMAFLRQLRERWIAKPDTMPALYELKGGADTEWLTSKDLEWLRSNGQIVEAGGKKYVLPPENSPLKPKTEEEILKAGGREIVAGVDAQKDELAVLKKQAAQHAARREIEKALTTSQVALSYDVGDKAGRLSQTLTLAELRELERQGKVLYFNADPDPRQRLRLLVHPLAARWRGPDELVIMVQVSGEPVAAGAFPSLEALEASDYARLFRRAEFGRKGVEALLSEADRDGLRARRAGWINLKLQSYAFALDKSGEIAAVYMSEDELKKAKESAKDPKAPEHVWTFHLTAALRVGLDADGAAAMVSDGTFAVKLGGAPLTWLEGDIWALELDGSGRVVRVFRSQHELEAESGSWWIEDMEGKIWKQTDKDIAPLARLKRYIDPKTGLPVLLGRPILSQRLAGAEKGLGANDRWSYMPWNWGNIILETPRGIIKTPIEMITGRDPNQDGYIGRVYMRQTDGGATEHRGVLGKVVHAIDIFEILPDHVDRYYDPSQFPSRVNNDSPIKPGEWEHQKDPVSTDGKKDVVLGHGSLLREIGWAKEDLEDARGQIIGSFQGSVRRSFVEQVRGRAGEYVETKVDHQTGRLAVETTLGQIGDATSPEGSGSLTAAPDHIAVDAVQVSVQVGLGAAQQDQRKKLYEDYLKKMDSRKPPSQQPDYDKLIAQAELALAQSQEARLALRAAADAATPKANLPGFPLIPRLYMAAVGR